ncbi:MAG TPA: NAD(P)/FAD-dependent oxidoreductase, partial [archaeon]|nr:NAD(P)/FAD-dependent oxidoreductase [archaeon]
KAPKDAYFVQGVQGRAKGSFDKRFVQLHFGSSFAKGFFAWVVPESPTSAVIGTAVPLGENISKSFDALLAKFDLKQSDLTGKNGGLIPVGPPMPQVSNGNALLLGDAAFQVKSSTGGGIINSCVAAQLAAKVIAGNHSGHLKSLAEYDKLCREHLNPDLHLHWRVHKFLKALTDAQFDDLIQKANKSKAGEFLSRHGDMDRPTKFWGKISKGPQFWRFAPELVKFALT